MALTNWNDILNKPKGIDEVPEIALTVEQLSASVLSISEDVGEMAEDVQEIAIEVSQLSASTLPYSVDQSIKQKIDEVDEIGGKAVYIGGVDSTEVSTSSLTEITVNDISQYKLLRIFTSYYKQSDGPDYGGEVISVNLFKRLTTETLRVNRFDNSYGFTIRYKSNTKVEISYPTGTPAATNCLQIWAIL